MNHKMQANLLNTKKQKCITFSVGEINIDLFFLIIIVICTEIYKMHLHELFELMWMFHLHFSSSNFLFNASI